MATGLEAEWNRMTLTEAEEEVFDFEESGAETIDAQIALCLVGKLLTNNQFNVEAFKSTMKNVWRPTKGVVVNDLARNLFSFQFFSQADKDAVLNDGRWAFDGNLLLLQQMDGNKQPSEIEFSVARFWVKVCDLPMKKKTYAYAEALASKLGAFVEVDEEDLLAPSKYLKVKVDIDITKPLLRGLRIRVGDELKWIPFKYVKLPEFCYAVVCWDMCIEAIPCIKIMCRRLNCSMGHLFVALRQSAKGGGWRTSGWKTRKSFWNLGVEIEAVGSG